MGTIPDFLPALAIATIIATVGWRYRMLSLSGAVASIILGTGLVGFGGWAAGFALVIFFVIGSVTSRIRRNQSIDQARGSRRDAIQVIANGGVALVAAIGWQLTGASPWKIAIFGAIAGACADTLSTEFGRTSATLPRLITTGRRVPRGTSGGVTVRGLAGAALGGAVIAAFVIDSLIVVAIAGTCGSIADSLLGATVQAVRRCPVCGRTTEAATHCGVPTVHAGGLRWMTNDTVNVLCTAIAAGLAVALWTL